MQLATEVLFLISVSGVIQTYKLEQLTDIYLKIMYNICTNIMRYFPSKYSL